MVNPSFESISVKHREDDFPKFAQLDPSEEECRRLHGIAVKLVQETAPAQPGSAPPQIVPPKIN